MNDFRIRHTCQRNTDFGRVLLTPLERESLADIPELQSLLVHELSMMPYRKPTLLAWIAEQQGKFDAAGDITPILDGLAAKALMERLHSSLAYPLRDLTCEEALLVYRQSLSKLDDGERSPRSIIQAAPEFPIINVDDEHLERSELKVIVKNSWERGFGSTVAERAELLAIDAYNKHHPEDQICIFVEGLIASDLLPWMGGSNFNSTGNAPNVPVFYALRMPSGETAMIPLTVAKPGIEGRINNLLPIQPNPEIFHGLKPSRILGDEPFLRDRNPYAGIEGVDHRAQLLEDIWHSLITARERFQKSEIRIAKLPEDCTREGIEEVIDRCFAALLESKLIASPERLLAIPREKIVSDIEKRLEYVRSNRPTYSPEEYAERKARGYPSKMPLDGIPLPLYHVAIDSIRTFEKGILRAYDDPDRFIRTGERLKEVVSKIENTRYIEVTIQDPSATDGVIIHKIAEEGKDKNYKNRMRRIVQNQLTENIRRLEKHLGFEEMKVAGSPTSGERPEEWLAGKLEKSAPAQRSFGLILGPDRDFDRWTAYRDSLIVLENLIEHEDDYAEKKAQWQRAKEEALSVLRESVPEDKYKDKKRAIDEEFGMRWETVQMSYLQKRCDLLMDLAYLQSDAYSASNLGTKAKDQFCDSFLQRIVHILDTDQFKLIYVVNDREELVLAEEALRPLLGVATPRPSHSELAEGGNVFGAGELLFERYRLVYESYSEWIDSYYGFGDVRDAMWKIVEINNGSGHYRPPVEVLTYVESVVREFMELYNAGLRARGELSSEVMLTHGAILKTDALARGRDIGDVIAVY